MKKIIYMAVAVLAMSLVSCDGTKNQGENKTGSQPVVEQTTSDDDSTEKQVAAVPNGLTGDMEKDAEMIVKATMEQSMKMAEGNDDGAEQQKLQKLMEAAKNYYGQQGKSEEFAQLVGKKMAAGITDVAAKLKNH